MFGTVRRLGQPALAVAVGVGGAGTAGAESACADLGGTVDNHQSCHVQSATASSTIDYSFPVDYPDQQALTDALTQEHDRFVGWVAQDGPSQGRDRPYQDVVTAKTFRSGTTGTGTQSLVLQIENDTGLAHQGHPDTTYVALNYDAGKQAPITFDTLLRPDADPVEVLNPIVGPELENRWGPAVLTPLRHAGASAYRNFAITDEAVTFFFGEDQLVADNVGPYQVSVPRAKLGSVLNYPMQPGAIQ